jgi:hypothetical protein
MRFIDFKKETILIIITFTARNHNETKFKNVRCHKKPIKKELRFKF